jgi:hypothetical protein
VVEVKLFRVESSGLKILRTQKILVGGHLTVLLALETTRKL